MITDELQKKIDRSIKLLKTIASGYDGEIEVAYSGGKDSDVILQLAKEAGIKHRAIYKNTTIDPPGTIKHAREVGAEVLTPKRSFLQLVAQKGYPSRYARFCCSELKEYKVLDKVIMGVRKAESTARMKRYSEPTECRFYGSKKEHVEAIYPILEWTDEDVKEYILDRGIKCAPLYYDEQGVFHVERRLGCMCCPLQSKQKRISEFKKYPHMVKAYIKACQKFLENKPNTKCAKNYSTPYEWFVREIFFENQQKFEDVRTGLFENDIDYKGFLEGYFKIKL